MSARFVETPSVEVTEELVATLIERGGFTHPLFQPGSGSRAEVPLPGQAVLLLAGGLVEQSGALDAAVAMLEMRSVRFLDMVRPGATLHVRLTPGPARAASRDRVVQELGWEIRTGAGTTVAEATVVMLMNEPMAAP